MFKSRYERSDSMSDLNKLSRVDSRVVVSLLWVAVMFIYVYADIQTFFEKGVLDAIISGNVAGMEISQIFLLSTAILMSIPSFMVFLSLILSASVNKWLNTIVSTLHIVLIISLQFQPTEKWMYYIYFNSIEVAFHLAIIYFAMKHLSPKK